MGSWKKALLLSMIFWVKDAKTQLECGMAPLNDKIVGGDDSTAGSWPWQVSMHLNGEHICGGTLISNQWVLTAGHCFTSSINPANWILYLGRLTQISTNPNANLNEVSITVAQIIRNPLFNETLFSDDIAVVQLSSSVTFTDYIRPICLAAQGSLVYNDTSCWATGWGNIGKNELLPSPQTLQEVELPIVGNKQCACDYVLVQSNLISSSMICAGQQGKGTCQGDSGGPLQLKLGSQWIQVGITSFGVPCANKNFPEVYTRVSQYQNWITQNIAGATVGFVSYVSPGNNTDSSFACNISAQSLPVSSLPSSSTGVQFSLGKSALLIGNAVLSFALTRLHCRSSGL